MLRRCWSLVVLTVALAAGSCAAVAEGGARMNTDRLLLLVPDATSLTDPMVNLWLDAASEEGLHLVPVHDSDFVGPFFGAPDCAGVIMPDSIHRQASDPFLAAVRRFVGAGGKLMLVYDAGTLSPQGTYAPHRSRLSDLAGVDYALYDTLKEKTIEWHEVMGDSSLLRELGVPPGKYYPFEQTGTENSQAARGGNFEAHLSGYQFADLKYPSFVTSGNYPGQSLLRSGAGIVACDHNYQSGSVLFVNLPLGYLKANTDGLLLHGFLKYFAEHLLALPYLMAVPDGVGGLVLNWHVDSNAAIRPLQDLISWKSLESQGPYSIHVTAGPDDTEFGDHQGFDIEHNRLSQEEILHYSKLGSEIGSHGGWVHDYFSAHVATGNPTDLEPLLTLNKSALEQVTGKPVVEYSAPSGNQPPWVTKWLEAHGLVAYYYTGDSGMGPTQGYRDGAREGQNIWAFPITHLNRAAAFEEMKLENYSDQEVEHWLVALTEFTVEHHLARLVYFHPPGILSYKQVVTKWFETTGHLKAQGRFRWYTMAELAKFLNSRKQVEWRLSEEGPVVRLEATHPQNLEDQTWWLPGSRFSKPRILQGAATITNEGDGWTVVAGKGNHLQIETESVVK